MLPKVICMVGTDTEIGKTQVCCAILHYLAAKDRQVCGLKPLASGLLETPHGWINQDVEQLYQASNVRLKYSQINQYSFREPIAPHIAAKKQGVELRVEKIAQTGALTIAESGCEIILIEGVGGIMTPLNQQETYLDLLTAWNFPLVLIVGMKLGCLNHALLTMEALTTRKLDLVGWIANCILPDMPSLDENLTFLKLKLDVPLLATLPYSGQLLVTPDFKKVFV